jgi:hypothetical protein
MTRVSYRQTTTTALAAWLRPTTGFLGLLANGSEAICHQLSWLHPLGWCPGSRFKHIIDPAQKSQ